MTIAYFIGHAVTEAVSPGTERSNEDGSVSIRDRAFTDIVVSSEPAIAGRNVPVLNIDLDPSTGTGKLSGRFELRPDALQGAWNGELSGSIENGLVIASGLAVGSMALVNKTLRIDFRQIEKLPFESPCRDPKAFFEINGMILQQS